MASCFASDGAHIYGTTDPGVANPLTGELYLVFRGDDSMRHHLRRDEGWEYLMTVSKQEPND